MNNINNCQINKPIMFTWLCFYNKVKEKSYFPNAKQNHLVRNTSSSVSLRLPDGNGTGVFGALVVKINLNRKSSKVPVLNFQCSYNRYAYMMKGHGEL